MKQPAQKHTYSTLITDLASLIEQGRRTAVRYVNTALVATYWLIGRRIVEYEQKGKERAEYGEALLLRLSEDLTKTFGKGWGEAHLRAVRQFYLIYKDIEKRYTLCSEFEQPIKTNIRHAPCSKSSDVKFQTPSGELFTKVFPLSWSHYRLLMRLDEPFKRKFYESECIRGNWSVRQLDRQIQSMLYERTALSRRKMAVIKNKTVVEYSLGGMNNKVFASKYRLKLPDPKVLKREIEHERQRLLEMKIVKEKQ